MNDFAEFNEYIDGPNFNQPDDAFMPFFEKKEVSVFRNVSEIWRLKHLGELKPQHRLTQCKVKRCHQ